MRHNLETTYSEEDCVGRAPTLSMVGRKTLRPVLELSSRPVTIGRAKDCDVVLRDPCISAYHAQIYRSHGEYYILDLSSTNGTSVNSQSIGRFPQLLKPGDLISISACRLAFQEYGETAENFGLVSRPYVDLEAKRNCVRVPKPIARWLRELAAERDAQAEIRQTG